MSTFKIINKTLITYDHLNLSAQLFNIKKNLVNENVIIYVHSYGSCKGEAYGILNWCARYGYDLCCFDQRGSGESGKSRTHFGVKEKYDLLYICFYLMARGYQNAVIWGRSMGVCTVLSFIKMLQSNYNSKFFLEQKFK